MKVPLHSMPISMKDQGFYDEHSQSQLAIINMTLPFIQEALFEYFFAESKGTICNC